MASSFSQAGAGSTCSQTNEFNFSVRLGLVFIVQAAVSSGIAVATLLAYIGVRDRRISKLSERLPFFRISIAPYKSPETLRRDGLRLLMFIITSSAC